MANFFGGSSRSTTIPIGKLFDFGIFSNAPENKDTKGEAEILRNLIQAGKFHQDPSALNPVIDRFLDPSESFADQGLITSILSNLQGKTNARGIGGTPLTEQLQAVAPFELDARRQFLSELGLLSGIRDNDLLKQQNLVELSRPTQAFGSITTNKNTPSVISAINSSISTLGKIQDFGTKTFANAVAPGSGSLASFFGSGTSLEKASSPFSSGNSVFRR
jgi:hypothetical protein